MKTTTGTASNGVIGLTRQIILFGLPILYFCISVFFYLKTYDSAQIKITLIQIGGTILLGSWLVKMLEEDVLDFFTKNIMIVLALLAFLVSGAVSYMHSPFTLASLNELIRRVLYIGIALIVLKEFNTEKKFKTLFWWLFAAAVIATLYGLVQFLDSRFFPPPPEPGLDPFIWRLAFGQRIFSTFGNPNFFGDFLVVMGPLTLAMYLRSRKISLLLLWVLIAFCVIFTESKGAWLGFAVGMLVFVFLTVGFFLNANKQRVRKLLFGMLAATLLVAGLGLAHNLKGRPDSASFRIFTWLSTWEMINTHPVIGTGIGTFYVTYPSWRRPQIFYIEGRHNTETDHPENEYLEVWYDEGIIGIGIFLWILTLFLTMGFNNLKTFSRLRDEKNKIDSRAYYQLGILTAIVAQLAHNYVCVSLRFVSSGVFLWLLIGLIGAINLHSWREEEHVEKPNTLPVFPKRMAQGFVVVAALLCVKVFYGYFKADVNHNIAIFFSKQGQWQMALKQYDTVIAENPSFIMAHYFMGNVYNDRWATGDAARSIQKYDDVWRLAPNYVQSHHQAGLIYLKWGEDEKRQAQEARARGDKQSAAEHEQKQMTAWQKALTEFQKYREIDPIFPLNYYRMAWIYMQLGQYDKAEEMYRAHLTYPAQLARPPHNAWVEDWMLRRKPEYAETYMNLGNLAYMRHDEKTAEECYRQSLEYYPNFLGSIKNLAVLYQRQNKIRPATELWNKARMLAPNDPDVKQVFRQ